MSPRVVREDGAREAYGALVTLPVGVMAITVKDL